MSMNRTCPISSAISFLTSAAIWVHVEMPHAPMLLSLLARVERKACASRGPIEPCPEFRIRSSPLTSAAGRANARERAYGGWGATRLEYVKESLKSQETGVSFLTFLDFNPILLWFHLCRLDWSR